MRRAETPENPAELQQGLEKDFGYDAAMQELDEILAEIEDDTVDMDMLTERVHRASELVKWCKDKITRTQMEIEHIVTELDAAMSDTPVVQYPSGLEETLPGQTW